MIRVKFINDPGHLWRHYRHRNRAGHVEPWPLVGPVGVAASFCGAVSFPEEICGMVGAGGSSAWPLVQERPSSTGIVMFVPGSGGRPPSTRISCSCSVDPELNCLICNSSRWY